MGIWPILKCVVVFEALLEADFRWASGAFSSATSSCKHCSKQNSGIWCILKCDVVFEALLEAEFRCAAPKVSPFLSEVRKGYVRGLLHRTSEQEGPVWGTGPCTMLRQSMVCRAQPIFGS